MATIRPLRGRWQAMVRRRGVPPRCKSFDKRTDATRWARALEAEADRSGWVADTRLAEKTTLGELLTRYRDQVSPTKRSAHTEKARINAMVRRPIAHRTLAKLTSADIATYRDERLKDVAPATVIRELNTIGHAIEIALRELQKYLRGGTGAAPNTHALDIGRIAVNAAYLWTFNRDCWTSYKGRVRTGRRLLL
jgi:hypothetical protein